MKVAVVGAGYVGLSMSTLLSTKYDVMLLEIIEDKINMINKRISPIKDKYIKDYFKNKKLNLTATSDKKLALTNANYIIIATPTNYDENTNYFDTSAVENTINDAIKINPTATIIIKSTIPVGFTQNMKDKYNIKDIIFFPEFLRESNALYDMLYPSRIIVGGTIEKAKEFVNMLIPCLEKKDVPILYMENTEAEAVKLFANTYLALRISYFNELDTFAEEKGLNASNIIKGVSLDDRIGNYYNNPSFGYGGYCLPKDTKQLLANYKSIPQNLIGAIIKSNVSRKNYIANVLKNKLLKSTYVKFDFNLNKLVYENKYKTCGIYRLTMKANSDNFRESAIFDIIEILKSSGIKIIIYEPLINKKEINECILINNFDKFQDSVDLIIANRIDNLIATSKKEIYTRDLYNRD